MLLLCSSCVTAVSHSGVQRVQPGGGVLPGHVPGSRAAAHVHGRGGRLLGPLCADGGQQVRHARSVAQSLFGIVFLILMYLNFRY